MTSKPLARTRNRAALIVDAVVGIVIVLVGVFYMFFQLGLQFQAGFEAFSVVLKVLTVASWLVGVAVFILFLVRRRLAFYWPIVGLVLMYLSGIVVLAIAGATK